MTKPDFAQLSRLEEAALAARLDAVRATISHDGEKGRALEQSVVQLLRDILPAEYGLSTGFIAYRSTDGIKLSSQVDIIIYDAVRTGPLARLGSCDVFPLEAVYAYVEVKACVVSASDAAKNQSGSSIEQCLQQNKRLRQMCDRQYFTQSPMSPIEAHREVGSTISIRSYLVAFAADGTVASDAAKLAKRMADITARQGDPTHFHGVFVANSFFLRTRPSSPDARRDAKWHTQYVTENSLAVFRTTLLHDLARFPHFRADQTPALEDYFSNTEWLSAIPDYAQTTT
jgi:hypothetical protein